MSRGPGLVAAAVAAAVTIALGGCGTSRTAARAAGPASGIASVPLATAMTSSAGTSWAVLQLGGSSANFENFWQLFVRPAGATRWQLATPSGVATNGGLVAAATGAASLITGFRPSQDLTFSPLSATADDGARWSQSTLISPGLASAPGALAAGPGGRLIALTDHGGAELGTPLGTSWTRLTSDQALALTAAGRACSLAGLTAAGWTPDGAPLLAGGCDRPGAVGIFVQRGGAWRATGPALPAGLSHSTVEVAGLASSGTRTTAVLAVGHKGATRYLAAWSDDGGGRWVLSAMTGPGILRSVAMGSSGSADLVLAGDHGVAIAGPGASWQSLPALPTATQALAAGPAGQMEALAAARNMVAVWRLGPAGTGAAGWSQVQALHVAIPYGSS